MANTKGAVHISVKLDGTEVPDGQWQTFTIDRDLNQPDMAMVVITNTDHSYSQKCAPGQLVEIVMQSGEKLFQGEIVGLEPIYKGQGESKIVLRCFNKMHNLLRGRSSKTYNEKNDKQIITEVLGKYGLTIDWKGPELKHKVVYQHNQTDLEFVRTRAARLGCNIWCVDKKVFVKRPELDKDSGVLYSVSKGIDGAEQIRSFMPRMSSAPVVKKVTVKGWNEETKELIVGEATVDSSKLGSSQSSAASEGQGKSETFTVDQPIRSVEEAKELAKARLIELSLGYMTGELEVLGTGKIEPGIVIEIIINDQAEDKFNGKYFVAGVSHRFVADKNSGDGGFITTARLQRDAQSAAGKAKPPAPPAASPNTPAGASPVPSPEIVSPSNPLDGGVPGGGPPGLTPEIQTPGMTPPIVPPNAPTGLDDLRKTAEEVNAKAKEAQAELDKAKAELQGKLDEVTKELDKGQAEIDKVQNQIPNIPGIDKPNVNLRDISGANDAQNALNSAPTVPTVPAVPGDGDINKMASDKASEVATEKLGNVASDAAKSAGVPDAKVDTNVKVDVDLIGKKVP
jgi:uncharacterized protein